MRRALKMISLASLEAAVCAKYATAIIAEAELAADDVSVLQHVPNVSHGAMVMLRRGYDPQ